MSEIAHAASLEELKKENESAEQQEQQPVEEEIEQEEIIESEDDTSEEENEESEENLAWMEPEGDQEEPEKKFTDSDVAAAKRKLKAKLNERNEEVEALKRENEALKQQAAPPSPKIEKPLRENFETDEAYLEALADHRFAVKQAETSTAQAIETQKAQAAAQKVAVDSAVDQHYVRAHDLAEKSGISPEAYQTADLRVREAIESQFPGTGDGVADYLISVLGEGSEKVFYNIGVNASRRELLVEKLKEDPTGLAASVYLGTLKQQLTTPPKRSSSAPAPGTDIQGDQNAGNAETRNLKKQWEKAHKAGDTQKAFEIRKKAKEKDIDVKAWTR